MTSSITNTWSEMFPNVVDNVQTSTVFMKKLFAVGVSNIMYLRGIFPESSFGDRVLDGLPLKILKGDAANVSALKVIDWVRSVFEPIDKNYLRSVTLAFLKSPEEPETVCETYTFKFDYQNQSMEVSENVSGTKLLQETADLKKKTMVLLRTLCVLSGSLESLPENAGVNVFLQYYADVTPEDYEPRLFQKCQLSEFKFEEDVTNVKIGKIDTRYHSMKLNIKAGRSLFSEQAEISVADKSMNSLEVALMGLDADEASKESSAEEGTKVDDQKVPEISSRTQKSSIKRKVYKKNDKSSALLNVNKEINNSYSEERSNENVEHAEEAEDVDMPARSYEDVPDESFSMLLQMGTFLKGQKSVNFIQIRNHLEVENTVTQGVIKQFEEIGILILNKRKSGRKTYKINHEKLKIWIEENAPADKYQVALNEKKRFQSQLGDSDSDLSSSDEKPIRAKRMRKSSLQVLH